MIMYWTSANVARSIISTSFRTIRLMSERERPGIHPSLIISASGEISHSRPGTCSLAANGALQLQAFTDFLMCGYLPFRQPYSGSWLRVPVTRNSDCFDSFYKSSFTVSEKVLKPFDKLDLPHAFKEYFEVGRWPKDRSLDYFSKSRSSDGYTVSH